MEILKIKKNVIDENIIPEFSLSNGQICGIFIPNYFESDIEYKLIDFLTQDKTKDEITILEPFYEVKDLFHEKTFLEKYTKKYLVRKFIKNYLKCNNLKALEIFNKLEIDYESSMYTCEGNARRKLSILLAFENHKNIIYKTDAISVEGITQLNKIVKEQISVVNRCAIEINFFSKKDSIVPLDNYDSVVEINNI